MTRPAFRLAHFADTHLGYRALGRADPFSGRNQRAVDIERAFEAAIDAILAHDVDLVVHAGDVFHHTRPSWSTLRCFVHQMRRIEAAGLPCVVIGGNHDTPRLRTTGSVFSLLEMALPTIKFVASYDLVEIPLDQFDLRLHALPHGALTNPNPEFPVLDHDKRNILITHGLAPTVQFRGHHEPADHRLGPELLAPDFDYVALGDFHLFGDQGRDAWYSGSTERFGWGDESATPGLLLVDFDPAAEHPAVEHIPLATRPMKTLAPLDGAERSARELADLILDRVKATNEPDALLRIELRQTPRPTRRETESILRRESPDLAWSVQVFSPADWFDGKSPVGDAELPPLRTMFSTFVAEQATAGAYEPAFAADFDRRGGRALDDAAQLMEAIAGEEPA